MLEQLLLVPLHHAPDGDDRLAGAVLLETAGLNQRIDRLLLRRINEAAGVDDDDLGGPQIADVLGTAPDEAREVALAVDGILVATQGDESDSHPEKTSRGKREERLRGLGKEIEGRVDEVRATEGKWDGGSGKRGRRSARGERLLDRK